MSIIEHISSWLKDYDNIIKVVTAIAAPGGFWFYIDKFRTRIRIKVRELDLTLFDTTIRKITFEAENVSSILTSFEPYFTLTGYSPERKKQTYTFTIEGNDRQLPSHVSRHFTGQHNNTDNRIIVFLWFMTFRLPLSRGRCVRVRFTNSDFVPIGFIKFQWARLLFIWFGRVPK
jgi:hypothetical protein